MAAQSSIVFFLKKGESVAERVFANKRDKENAKKMLKISLILHVSTREKEFGFSLSFFLSLARFLSTMV